MNSEHSGPGASPQGSRRWYFCVRHQTVEGEDGCPGKDRLGPYPTKEAAEHALETVRERNQEWDVADGNGG